MIAQIRTALHRNGPTLAQDMAGALAIAVMLMVALHLPGLV